jgi:hypothetical protein
VILTSGRPVIVSSSDGIVISGRPGWVILYSDYNWFAYEFLAFRVRIAGGRQGSANPDRIPPIQAAASFNMSAVKEQIEKPIALFPHFGRLCRRGRRELRQDFCRCLCDRTCRAIERLPNLASKAA